MTDEQIAEGVRIGHNSGDTLPTVDQIVADLEAANAEALARVTALLAKGVEFYTVADDDADSAATEFMVKNRARWKASEADRVAAKDPWDTRAGAVHAFFKTRILDPLAAMGAQINEAQTEFKKAKAERERKAREAEAARLREEERIAREAREAAERARRAEEDRQRREREAAAAQARQQAEEAAAAASRKRNAEARAQADAAAQAAREAAARAEEAARLDRERQDRERADREEADRLAADKAAEERAEAERAASASLADLSRARGQKGGVSSLKESVAVRDIDRAALDYSTLGPYFKDAAVEQALKAYADANKATVNAGIKTGQQPIRGAVFYLQAKSAGRS